MPDIRAGTVEEACQSSGEWVFVDMGFSSERKSCCLLTGSGAPVALTFSDLQCQLVALARSTGDPLNLAIEAPLSVAFGPEGNPVGRRVEQRDKMNRYWYFGAGCGVMVATTYLLRTLTDSARNREIRLFEGLASFKGKGNRPSHSEDVLGLQDVLFGRSRTGNVIAPQDLASSPTHVVVSAFAVAGMHYGIPPVIAVGG